jgi:hypothetical protein
VAAGLVLSLTLAFAGAAPVVLAAPPTSVGCPPAEPPPPGVPDPCPPTGGLDLGLIVPIALAGAGGVALALGLAYVFVLRRRATEPLEPVDAAEWWTCRQCGRNNVVGSARCYGCGQWQG